jgi:hypothetical protein
MGSSSSAVEHGFKLWCSRTWVQILVKSNHRAFKIVRAKTGWLWIRTMYHGGATCLSVDCSHYKTPTEHVDPIQCRHHLLLIKKTWSYHDIAKKKCSFGDKQQSLALTQRCLDHTFFQRFENIHGEFCAWQLTSMTINHAFTGKSLNQFVYKELKSQLWRIQYFILIFIGWNFFFFFKLVSKSQD